MQIGQTVVHKKSGTKMIIRKLYDSVAVCDEVNPGPEPEFHLKPSHGVSICKLDNLKVVESLPSEQLTLVF